MSERKGAVDRATIAAYLAERRDDHHLGLCFEGQQWTWREVVECAEVRARALRAARRPRHPFHIGVLLDNVPDYLFVLAGAALAGAVVVGINPTRRGEELAADIRHTDCQLVVTDRAHRALLHGLDLGIEADRIWEVDSPSYRERLDPAGERQRLDPAGERERSDQASHREWVDHAGTAADQGELGDPHVEVCAQDLYLLLFTSGTSGAPKAVRMTHERAARVARSGICSRHSVVYCAMPLFHGNALAACVFPAMFSGGAIVLRRRFSASAFLDDVRAFGCTYFSAIGRVITYLLATPERADDADNPLQFVLGPETSAADIERFETRFGCPVFTGYGSSENAIVLRPAPGVPRSALGVPADGHDIAIVDPETGLECPRARIDDAGRIHNLVEATGEIVGRNTLGSFEGYYNNEDAMAQRSRGGWYWSGDLGYRDEHGVFWFAGRTADWIRVDGENFATAPVERILGRFPAASGVAVYGVPDERTAEDQVMVTLEMSPGADFDPVAFAAFLEDQTDLGTKWAPRYVRVGTLPVTGTDKIDKQPLRAQAWVTEDPVWWRPDRRDPTYHAMTDGDRAALRRAFVDSGRSTVAPGEV